MRKMLAIARGFMFGRIIEPGEVIQWPHPNDPSWLEAAAGRDAADASEPEAEPLSELDRMTKAELVRHARDAGITIDASAKKNEVLATIKAASGREVFGEAPPPGSAAPANGLQAAFGGIQPDWVPQPAKPAGD